RFFICPVSEIERIKNKEATQQQTTSTVKPPMQEGGEEK
ncbi:unnamed protein product, partial [marine sediment metagenome]